MSEDTPKGKPRDRNGGRWPHEALPQHTVSADDVGLTEVALGVLRALEEGGEIPPGHSPYLVQLQRHGFIDAAGDSPEDGWTVTVPGRRLLRQAGTFIQRPAPPLMNAPPPAMHRVAREGPDLKLFYVAVLAGAAVALLIAVVVAVTLAVWVAVS